MEEAAGFSERDDLGSVWVAEFAGEPIGYVALGRRTSLPSNGHVGRIRSVAVHPDHRGRGAARALLRAAIGASRERGDRKLVLNVLAGNRPAVALYESLGFETEGRLVEEFELGGRLVDDLLLALRHCPPGAPEVDGRRLRRP